MPNWASNNLLVQGKPGVVKQFIQENFKVQENKEYVLDFEQFDPTPIDPKTCDVIEDWYNWRLNHWGSKWSPCVEQSISLSFEFEDETESTIVYDIRCREGEKVFSEQLVRDMNIDDVKLMKLELACYFETPWGPPSGIFQQWYEKYGELGLEAVLKFYEPGCCVLGEMGFKGKEEYYEEWIESDNREEWIKYTLDEGWEDKGYYTDECIECIYEMWDGKNNEARDLLISKVEEGLKQSDNEASAKLIASIFDSHYKWLNEGDENNGDKE